MSFEEALEIHLNAVKHKDLETFVKTLVSDGKLSIILPNGSTLSKLQEIIDFHKNWFADPDWSLDLKPVESWHTESTGAAIFNATYNDLDAKGKPYSLNYIVTLVFIKKDDQWLLVHDQNTMLADITS